MGEAEDVATIGVDVAPALAEMLLAGQENREAPDELDGPVVFAVRGALQSRVERAIRQSSGFSEDVFMHVRV